MFKSLVLERRGKKVIFIVYSAFMALEIFFKSSVVNILSLIHYYLPAVSMGI